jgi:hypothetical protein
LGGARIYVQARAELDVVATAAVITEERLAGGHAVALMAITHIET